MISSPPSIIASTVVIVTVVVVAVVVVSIVALLIVASRCTFHFFGNGTLSLLKIEFADGLSLAFFATN